MTCDVSFACLQITILCVKALQTSPAMMAQKEVWKLTSQRQALLSYPILHPALVLATGSIPCSDSKHTVPWAVAAGHYSLIFLFPPGRLVVHALHQLCRVPPLLGTEHTEWRTGQSPPSGSSRAGAGTAQRRAAGLGSETPVCISVSHRLRDALWQFPSCITLPSKLAVTARRMKHPIRQPLPTAN